jgi:hypothetical protein
MYVFPIVSNEKGEAPLLKSNADMTLTAHHDGEEENFFPWIEEAAGEPGLMMANVEQHSKPFIPALSAKLVVSECDLVRGISRWYRRFQVLP